MFPHFLARPRRAPTRGTREAAAGSCSTPRVVAGRGSWPVRERRGSRLARRAPVAPRGSQVVARVLVKIDTHRTRSPLQNDASAVLRHIGGFRDWMEVSKHPWRCGKVCPHAAGPCSCRVPHCVCRPLRTRRTQTCLKSGVESGLPSTASWLPIFLSCAMFCTRISSSPLVRKSRPCSCDHWRSTGWSALYL